MFYVYVLIPLNLGCSASVLLYLGYVCSTKFQSLSRKEAHIFITPSSLPPLPARIMPSSE